MKSHFTFSKKQRNGIFLLAFLIIITQIVYFSIDFSSNDVSYNEKEYLKFVNEIDSLKQVEKDVRKPKIFPFNPNFITDFKGESLGMSAEEIDRLLKFRGQDKWINSVYQFQDVTKISDSLLRVISPHFKFPDWVTNPKTSNPKPFSYSSKTKTYAQKHDLNTATAKELQKVYGIGEYYSKRIVNFRNKFVGGFISDVQLQDINGLTPEVINNITNHFTVKTPRKIDKIYLNTALIEELVTIQHIDYDLASKIIEQRTLRDGFTSFDELTKVKDFPVNKLDIIKLYLLIEKEN